MQRSNNNRQSTSTGRRIYNRSHNNNINNNINNNHNNNNNNNNINNNNQCFKFHNFVFNETNQKFCLEEQHGNKKITVLHWKKSDEQQQSQKSEFKHGRVRNCDSDSKLIHIDKLKSIPQLLEKDEINDDDESTEMDIIHERPNIGVAASASFPLAFPSINLSYEASHLINESSKSPLPHPSKNSLISSGHSSASFLSPLDSSSSSNYNFAIYSDESISKSHNSGSSIATTSSSCSAINFSLDNLRINENLYRSGSRRKSNRVRKVLMEDDSEESDHSDYEDKDVFYRTYRQKIQQRIESLLDDVQSQPLDLSIKSKHNFNNNNNNKHIDSNNNNNNNKNNVDDPFNYNKIRLNNDDETISGCESFESLMSNSPKFKSYFDTPGSSWMSEGRELMRMESLSPSELISSMKCSSPLSDGYLEKKSYQSTSSSNPFMFPDKRSKRFENYEPNENRCRSTDIFDALLEEEIHKFLHNSSNTFTTRRQQTKDFNKKIEDKLKLLQQEVLNNRLSESDFFNFMSDSSNDDNLRLHFKFDSNKNLEPYMDSYKTRTGVGNLSSQLAIQSNTLPKSRLNHRNQIKRHLEDAFKQNGFLVKTKQVSDANNSAMFCKFRQLRKYTRYYLKSWQNHLPDEVNKLWKGFLPPKTERPLFLASNNAPEDSTGGSSSMNTSTNHQFME